MGMTPQQQAQLAAFKEVKVKHARLEEVFHSSASRCRGSMFPMS